MFNSLLFKRLDKMYKIIKKAATKMITLGAQNQYGRPVLIKEKVENKIIKGMKVNGDVDMPLVVEGCGKFLKISSFDNSNQFKVKGDIIIEDINLIKKLMSFDDQIRSLLKSTFQYYGILRSNNDGDTIIRAKFGKFSTIKYLNKTIPFTVLNSLVSSTLDDIIVTFKISVLSTFDYAGQEILLGGNLSSNKSTSVFGNNNACCGVNLFFKEVKIVKEIKKIG